MKKKAIKVFFILSLLSPSLNAGVYVEPKDYKESVRDIKVRFIDVGQGDCALICVPGKGNVLIDGGGETPSGQDAGAAAVLPALRDLNVQSLDYVILTHPHPDHANGLAAVLKKMTVRNYCDDGISSTEADVEGLRRLAEGKGVNYRSLKKGDELMLGSSVSLKVLGPPRGGAFENTNDNSLVLKFNHGSVNILFTADIQREGEEWLAGKSGEKLESDVIKAPHHGSYSSSTDTFLKAAGAKAVVVSCSMNNPFDHPHSTVLAKYRARHMKIFRTDIGGDVILTTDGDRFKIETGKKR